MARVSSPTGLRLQPPYGPLPASAVRRRTRTDKVAAGPVLPSATWSTVTDLVVRLLRVAEDHPLEGQLRARVTLLGRAVAEELAEPLLALEPTEPTREVDAWWDSSASARDLPGAAIWITVDAVRRLALGEAVKVGPVVEVIDAWADVAPTSRSGRS